MNKVLICPLNWGLGHAARCIPVAREFQRQGYGVDFASDGGPLDLLRLEFPDSSFYELPGYGITYPTNNILINVGRKIMTFLSAINAEHDAVKTIIQENKYDIIVSDNRFGCYNSETRNIFITHQVNILTPTKMLDPAVNTFNHYYIRKYEKCWIPDFEEAPGLSGKLGHDHLLPHSQYIGPVSRFKQTERLVKYRLTAVLSGPEPQRTILERKLMDQLPDLPYPTALVSGVISGGITPVQKGNMTHFSYLTSGKLNQLFLESDVILCRGGYSTVMDLVALNKKAICVPTPGQTEQEYLTRMYEKKGYFNRQLQDELDVKKAMEDMAKYTGITMEIDGDLLVKAIKGLSENPG